MRLASQWALGVCAVVASALGAVGASALGAATASAAERVSVPSLDLQSQRGTAVQLPGTWFVAPGAGAAPAIVLLHGCGGLYEGRERDRREKLAPRYTEIAAHLNALGVHALVLDSLTPRGERELCTQRTGTRQVTQLHRRRDALGALAWLAAQPGVDKARIGLLGWSNGGSTVLAATNLEHGEVARFAQSGAVQPSLAVALYPGCEAELQRGYRASAPLLLLLGEADDWTPAAPCKALAEQARVGDAKTNPQRPQRPQWESYEGAYHGFDGTAPLRLRKDVPNGVKPGAGVHVGANPPARAAARERLNRFLRETWGLGS
jgi:dienelactone hydrolase